MDIRIKFKKGNEVQYISHLDLVRTFNRILLRSELPVKYSSGFNPHMLLTFAQPLSVGMCSEAECAEITLTQAMDLDEVFSRLVAVSPAGIKILEVTDNLEPKFNSVSKAQYTVTYQCNKDNEEIIEILEQPEILIDKKTKKGIKQTDIKPFIYEYQLERKGELTVLKLLAAAGSVSNLNPSLLLKALEKYIEGLKIEYYMIVREYLLSDQNEKF